MQESHLLREDTDQYLLHAAIRHGAAYRDHATVDAIDIDDEGVTVRLDDGTTYHGRYCRSCGRRRGCRMARTAGGTRPPPTSTSPRRGWPG